MIYHNALVNRNAAYSEQGSLINGTQRITLEQPQIYWQQANLNIHLSVERTETVSRIIPNAIYVGRIPLHFGHFLIEGLSKMHAIPFMDMPYIGYITKGILPPGIKNMEETEARKILKILSDRSFVEIGEDESVVVENLIYLPPPMTLSHTVHDPKAMSRFVSTLAKRCQKIHNVEPIEVLRLNRLGEEVCENGNNPNDEVSLQIAKVHMSKKLVGDVGSNTHLSMFAKSTAITEFKYRNEPTQTDRNQILCELIRMYNE